MTSDEHCLHLGGLLGNFQSLEFILRVYLQQLPSARPSGIPYAVSIYTFPVGSVLPENEITSYDSLGILIDKFNKEMTKKQQPLIDKGIVEVRDAIAHGRISAEIHEFELRLIKFTKPQNGKVTVLFNEIMTADWFKNNKKRVNDAILLVHKNIR